jgi:hypothetical protein
MARVARRQDIRGAVAGCGSSAVRSLAYISVAMAVAGPVCNI